MTGEPVVGKPDKLTHHKIYEPEKQPAEAAAVTTPGVPSAAEDESHGSSSPSSHRAFDVVICMQEAITRQAVQALKIEAHHATPPFSLEELKMIDDGAAQRLKELKGR